MDISGPLIINGNGNGNGSGTTSSGASGGPVIFRSNNITRNGDFTITEDGIDSTTRGNGGLAIYNYCTQTLNSGTLTITANLGTGGSPGDRPVINIGPAPYCN